MVLLFLILILVLLLIVSLFTVASRLIFSFDTTTSNIHLTVLWLYPFLRSEITGEDDGLYMSVYLFNRRIMTHKMKVKKREPGKKSLIKTLNPTDVHINTRYGFRDPYVTGIACGVINAASQFFSVESLHQEPDFLASEDYISMDGTARLNLGRSLLKII